MSKRFLCMLIVAILCCCCLSCSVTTQGQSEVESESNIESASNIESESNIESASDVESESNVESESELKPEDFEYELSNYYYEINSDNTCTITGVKDTSIEDVYIPACVTKIAGSAFSGCTNIKKVFTPSLEAWCNIDFLADSKHYYAPYLVQYQSNPFFVHFLSNTENDDDVQDYVPADFYVDGVLTTDVIIPDTVNEIKSVTLALTNITSLKIADSVTTIGAGAFVGCTSLASVEIGNSVTTIEYFAFASCVSLTSIDIGDSEIIIGEDAFIGCYSLTNIEASDNNAIYKSIDGNLYSKDGTTLIRYAMGKENTEFIIPDSVTIIGEGAFSDSDSLTSVEIPDSVTIIGNRAFYDCDSLTSVEIGDSVTKIGNSAFYNCESLTSVTIGENVTKIGCEAFAFCYSLSSVTFKDTTTWYVTDYQSYKYGESIDVTDPLTNASRFSSDSYYCYKYWYKN